MGSSILILSNNTDKSTSYVLDWLYFNNEVPTRINDTDKITSARIVENHILLLFKSGLNVNVSHIKSCWFRRGKFQFEKMDKMMGYTHNNSITHSFKNEISFFLSFLRLGRITINKYFEESFDKMTQVIEACKVGLNVPNSFLCSSKDELRTILSSTKLITKSLNESYFKYNIDDNYLVELCMRTKLVDYDMVCKMNWDGIPALFQEYVEKKYELRIFYLNGEFYSMAIFSQHNNKTKIDFRNYDKENPNRNVPYKLPEEIKAKLEKFMIAIGVNCGSIDMIYTPEGKYVFLEVNPMGQYRWLEKNCNYPISKRIAETLINN